MHHLSATPPRGPPYLSGANQKPPSSRGWGAWLGALGSPSDAGWSNWVRVEGLSGSAEANSDSSLSDPSATIVDGVEIQSEAEDLLLSREPGPTSFTFIIPGQSAESAGSIR